MFPQEVEVWYIIPALRKKLAFGLVKAGMSQKEVARLMHLTEAAISQYQCEKRAQENCLGKEIDAEIRSSVKIILKNKNLLSAEMVRLNELVNAKGITCRLHKEKTKVEKSSLPCCECRYQNKHKLNHENKT